MDEMFNIKMTCNDLLNMDEDPVKCVSLTGPCSAFTCRADICRLLSLMLIFLLLLLFFFFFSPFFLEHRRMVLLPSQIWGACFEVVVWLPASFVSNSTKEADLELSPFLPSLFLWMQDNHRPNLSAGLLTEPIVLF